jgi:hypothetical protein
VLHDRNRSATEPSHPTRYVPAVVRAHKPSHNPRLALAGLGLAAALIAAAGSGQVSGAAVSSAASPDLPTDGTSIRDVDFSEVAVPGTVCREGLRFSQPREIPIQSGRSPVLDLARMTQVTVDPDVVYADLDGDGADEALVRVSCTFGANGIEDSVHAWTLGADGEPVNLASVSEPEDSVTGALPGTVTGVAAVDGGADITWTNYAEDDPNCCPSLRTTVTYRLVDGELVQTGEPVTSDAEAPILAT